jgi:hypothetical protein
MKSSFETLNWQMGAYARLNRSAPMGKEICAMIGPDPRAGPLEAINQSLIRSAVQLAAC